MNIRLSATQVSRDRWLVSYADFMTLLCAFFAALYAASIAAVPVALVTPVEATAAVVAVVEPAPPPAAPDPALALRAEVERALAPELAAGYVQLVEDPRGLVIEVPETAAFPVGQADLAPAAVGMLTRIGAMLATLPNAVRIEGHSDPSPIRTTKFASNWELSTARATSVVQFLVATSGLAPARLSAAGYAEFKPRATNDSTVGRARNRRVDLILLNEATVRAEEPGGEVRP